MAPDESLRRALIVARDLPWVTEMVLGPSRLGFETFEAYVEATAAFLERANTTNCGAVARFWLAHLHAYGTFPPYKGNWRRQLAPVLGNIAVRERFAPDQPTRYRYVGVNINAALGIDMTGRSIADFVPLPVDELVRIERMVHEDCRTCLTRRDFRNLDKAELMAVSLNVMLTDETGATRFNLTVGDFNIPVGTSGQDGGGEL